MVLPRLVTTNDGVRDAAWWGAVPGAGDVTAELQAALTAAAGHRLFLAPGTYVVSTGLTVPADTWIEATGATLDFSGAGNVTGLAFASGGGISGATILGAGGSVYNDAGRAIYCTGTNNHPAAPTYVVGPKVRDCTITGWSGYGIYLAFLEKADVQKNVISGIGYAGVAGLSCNDCVCDDNDISDVNGTGPPDAYGAFFDRSNGASETSVPRSYRCSMSHNRVSNIHTAGNSQGLDTHGGVECLFVGNTIWDVDLGIAVVSSKLGASFALAPQRCVVRGNVIVGRNANTGIVLTGASDDGVTFNEMAEGNTIEGNVIADAGLVDDVYDGGIRFYGTTNAAVAGNTIVRPNVNGVFLGNENHGFQVTGNTIVDPHGTAESGVCVRLHAHGQKGFVGGNTFRRENAALDVNVATHAIFATSGRLDCEVTIGPNAHVGATSTTLKTTLNNVDGIATWQRGADDAAPIGDAPYTLQVGLAARNQIINVSALTTNRVITLSTTNASRGDAFNVVRTVGDTGGPWLMDVGGLISLSRDEWCSVVFDGAAWGLAASGKLLKSGTGTPEGAVTGNVGDVFHRTDGGAGTTLYV
ncbi:MAG: right-handed parallel beta-helix repeat-containing protein, partial [Acidobacteria bacterium]|nr:right-handed parallel beta-helix repeat-containing protein [Acidobacteriota bacterium]